MMGLYELGWWGSQGFAVEAASHRLCRPAENMGFTLFDSVLVPSVTSGPTVMIAVGLAGIASFLDHPKSTASNLNVITRMISAIVRSTEVHRGGTHWLATCLMLTGGIYLIWQEFAIWFFIGYASHLALDMMTISGLKVGAGRHARAGAILITNILFAAQVHEISHRCVFGLVFRFLCWIIAALLFAWQVIPILTK